MRDRRILPYNIRLEAASRALRRDSTPAERKLWYEFLRDLPDKFTRQKPLGGYVVDLYWSYDAVRTAALRLASPLGRGAAKGSATAHWEGA